MSHGPGPRLARCPQPALRSASAACRCRSISLPLGRRRRSVVSVHATADDDRAVVRCTAVAAAIGNSTGRRHDHHPSVHLPARSPGCPFWPPFRRRRRRRATPGTEVRPATTHTRTRTAVVVVRRRAPRPPAPHLAPRPLEVARFASTVVHFGVSAAGAVVGATATELPGSRSGTSLAARLLPAPIGSSAPVTSLCAFSSRLSIADPIIVGSSSSSSSTGGGGGGGGGALT